MPIKEISRREFFKISIALATSTFLPKVFLSAKEDLTGPLIGIARGEKKLLVGAVIDALGGIKKFVSQNDRVLIKPNLSFAAEPEYGATTSSEIIKQVVQLCLDAGAKEVLIVDYPLANAQLCIKKSRISEAVIDSKRVKIIMLDRKDEFIPMEIPDGNVLKKIEVARKVFTCDKIINLPTAKSHSATGVSLGLKNLMGLIKNRNLLHRLDLDNGIAELSLLIKPHLTIVDATRALISGGPGGPGKTVILNTVVAGVDPVAVDSCTVGLARWYGKSFSGYNVKHLISANKLGLGEIDTKRMIIKEVVV
ncbi:MAG: DUF362 domain-containing protein [candidate division WOR-3 bacterium]